MPLPNEFVSPKAPFTTDSPQVLFLKMAASLFALAGSGGSAVAIADGADVSEGAKADAVVTNPAASASVIALLKGMLTYLRESMGGVGADYVSDTTPITGTYCAIQALEDTVISTMTAGNISGTLTAIPLPSGVCIYGAISAFTLTSGRVLAYKR